MINELDTNIND